MNILTICPCCNNRMLHHLAHHRSYWFCRHCWQEMPNLSDRIEGKCDRTYTLGDLSRKLINSQKVRLSSIV